MILLNKYVYKIELFILGIHLIQTIYPVEFNNRHEFQQINLSHRPLVYNDAFYINHIYEHRKIKRFLTRNVLGFVVDIVLNLMPPDSILLFIIHINRNALAQQVIIQEGTVFAHVKLHLSILLHII